MEYTLILRMLGGRLSSMIKGKLNSPRAIREIKREYKAIINRAADIGSHNELIMSYGLAAYFIAMNRKTKISCEENYKILHDSLKESKLIKILLGNKKSYFSKKKMEHRRAWEKELKKHKYKNDWDLNLIDGNDEFEFGIDYIECGVCKLCRDEGVAEYAKYMCNLDFMLAELIGVKLIRTKTLAEGSDRCDFRYRKY